MSTTPKTETALDQPISDGLRAAMNQLIAGGLSQNKLAKLVGVPQSTLSAFLAGDGLTLVNADRIARAVGLSIRVPKNLSKFNRIPD